MVGFVDYVTPQALVAEAEELFDRINLKAAIIGIWAPRTWGTERLAQREAYDWYRWATLVRSRRTQAAMGCMSGKTRSSWNCWTLIAARGEAWRETGDMVVTCLFRTTFPLHPFPAR
jgi:hypothetical protein